MKTVEFMDQQTYQFKKCPYCAEQIQPDAIKCRYCGEFLDKPRRPKTKWYHSTTVLVIAILSVGPLALPLVWFHPRYSPLVKAAVSVGVIILTIVLCYATAAAYNSLLDQINTLGL